MADKEIEEVLPQIGPTLSDIKRMLDYRCRPGCDLCTDADTILQYILKLKIELEAVQGAGRRLVVAVRLHNEVARQAGITEGHAEGRWPEEVALARLLPCHMCGAVQTHDHFRYGCVIDLERR